MAAAVKYLNHHSEKGFLFQFESYGVRVAIKSDHADIVEQAEIVARQSLMHKVRELKGNEVDQTFELNRTKSGTFTLVVNGNRIASGRSRRKFFKFLDSMVRVVIGEFAVDRVFMHAGAVGWKGKAIIIPGESFKGKSTLVAALVSNGASYYSDDFAVFDGDGLLHAFPRPLAMRNTEGKFKTYELTPEMLGGVRGIEPIPVRAIVLTEYEADAVWTPEILTPGKGILDMVPFILPLRHRPDFSLHVLNKITSRAIIASGRRGSADDFAKTLLDFVDKHVN